MNRRAFVKVTGAAGGMLVMSPAVLLLEGCPSQSTIAALVTTLGNAAASIATLEGNSALAQKLTDDTKAAAAAITNWQSGSPAQMAIEAMNLVIDDLSLFPEADPYSALIVLALGTAESIIAILAPGQVTLHKGARQVQLTNPPKTSSDFKKQWNVIVGQHRDWTVKKL